MLSNQTKNKNFLFVCRQTSRNVCVYSRIAHDWWALLGCSAQMNRTKKSRQMIWNICCCHSSWPSWVKNYAVAHAKISSQFLKSISSKKSDITLKRFVLELTKDFFRSILQWFFETLCRIRIIWAECESNSRAPRKWRRKSCTHSNGCAAQCQIGEVSREERASGSN